MSRKKTNVQPFWSLKTSAGSIVDFGSEVVSIEFTDGDSNPVTFSDVANGVAATAATVSYVLDTAAGSAFTYHFANKGQTGVLYAFRFSNAVVGVDNPSIAGTLTMPRSPLFSHAMSEDGAPSTFEVTYQLDTYPNPVTV